MKAVTEIEQLLVSIKTSLKFLRNDDNYTDPEFNPCEYANDAFTAVGVTQITLKELATAITQLQSAHNELVDRGKWLRALEAAGVDNWEGYDTAVDIYNDRN